MRLATTTRPPWAFPMGNQGFLFPSCGPQYPLDSPIYSAFAYMLPYLEGTNTYNAYNFSWNFAAVANTTAQSVQVSAFNCPTDTQFTQAPAGDVQYVHSSYATNRGQNENIRFNWAKGAAPDPTAPYYTNCNNDPGDGMFGWQFSVRVASVTDGLSNTFLFGEVSRFIDEPASPYSVANITFEFGDDYSPYCGRPTSGALVIPVLNAPPDKTGAVYAACFAVAAFPPDWINVQACLSLGQYGFRSLHPGGANFAMADGSVKFIKNSINVKTYRGLGTRALGEILSADSY